jgi:branched-chain amino acid transport system ATP-binding protein
MSDMRMLEVRNLVAGYGPVEVLHGLDFTVEQGEVVVILGANGAGKTTTLRALSGMIPAKGDLLLDGHPINGKATEVIAQRGIAHVPQGRGTLDDLSVRDNLMLGAFTRHDRAGIAADIERWYTQFPRLRDRRDQAAGSMSGGEQQMLAIARALMARPRLVLLDEPSLGLAPIITQSLFRTLADLNREQELSMLIVEQNAGLALEIAHRGYVLEVGHIVVSGAAADLADNEDVRRAYLGV